MNERRTQAQRTATTREALVAAGRRLWAQRGYADVGTPEIALAAGVTRGAMYHQFAGKADLFRAVVDAVERDVTAGLAQRVADSGAQGAGPALHAAIDAWLDACERPEVTRIILLEAPVVLGWDGFRDVALAHGLGLAEQLLSAAVSGPTRGLAHVLIGALDEAALYAATASDPRAARAEIEPVLHRILDAILRTD
jgi:AcrR family transcriptional regulator